MVDSTKPELTMLGEEEIWLQLSSPFKDPGAVWHDSLDGNGSASSFGKVDVNAPGTYSLTYAFTDRAGNPATSVSRKVVVYEPAKIRLVGDLVEENLPAGTQVGNVVAFYAIDQNDSGGFQFVLAEGSELFSLSENGVLRTKKPFDFEEKESHQIRVKTTDPHGFLVEETLVVLVGDSFKPVVETLSFREDTVREMLLLSGEVVDSGTIQGKVERGFALSRSPDPTVGENSTHVLLAAEGIGSFGATPANLVEGKRYFFRAFASNGEGIAYGTQESFFAPKQPQGPSWAKAELVESAPGWWKSSWFGNFFLSGNGWINHESLGWLFPAPAADNEVWFWHQELGWIWTGQGLFPYLYVQNSRSWHYFVGSIGGRVLLFRYSDSEWLDVSEGSSAGE